MLIQFGTEVGNFFRETFVDKFDFWLVFGLFAQLMFAGRFIVQWISSERAGKSVVPFAFWIFSMGGGLMTLVYGIVKREPVIIFGQGVATLIYIRNIMLIYREQPQTQVAPPDKLPDLARGRERREAALEIGDQIVDILEPDMEAHRRAAGRPGGGAAHIVAIERDHQALEAAPRRADAEQRERVDEGVHRCLRHRLEHDAEQAARAGEVALPDRVAGTAFERRVEHARHLRPLREPARDLQPGLVVMRKAHRHGAQAAHAEIHVVGTDAEPHREHGVD